MRLQEIDEIKKTEEYRAKVRAAVQLNEQHGFGAAVWVQAIDAEPRKLFVRPTHPNDQNLPWGRPFAAWTLFELPAIPHYAR